MKFLVAHLPKNFDEVYSKKDLLNENVTQQSPSNSMKRNEDYIHAKAILKSPLFSAYRKTGTWDPSGTLRKPQNRDPRGPYRDPRKTGKAGAVTLEGA